MTRVYRLISNNWQSFVGSIRAFVTGMRTCRLCWRITLAVFLVFMGVELVVTKISAARYEAEQYATFEREALIVARSVIRMAAQDDARGAFVDAGALLRENSVLVGMQLFSESGIALDSFGERTAISPNTDLLGEEERQVVYQDRNRMEVVWPPSRLHAPYFATAIVDIEKVQTLVNAYQARSFWFTFLLASVTTVAAMLLLEKLILRPVRALNDGLRRLAADPAGSDHLVLDAVGTDELSEAAQSFYTLTGRLTAECGQTPPGAAGAHRTQLRKASSGYHASA